MSPGRRRLAVGVLAAAALSCTPERPPNFLLLLADDLGYGDLGSYGGQAFETPALDRMAAEGMRLTDFYAGAPSCTASRAALLTGSHPLRIGMEGVLFPNAPIGLPESEITLSEALRARGYRTGCIGKWHLGDREEYLPWNHGFDHTFVVPYSHDMGRPLPLLANGQPLREIDDPRELTQLFTEAALAFLAQDDPRPFFLYLAYTAVHKPVRASPRFEGRSGAGAYGDAVGELDWSVGEILRALEAHGVDRDTLVVFTSDNGAWHRGSGGPLVGRKGGSWEGAVRVPLLARWPGHIPPDASSPVVASAVDLFPTFANLARAEIPSDRVIDGRNIWPALAGSDAGTLADGQYYYYRGGVLCGVRRARWKLLVCEPRYNLRPEPVTPRLYDLGADLGEREDVASRHPDVVAELQELVERVREDLGDEATQRVGRNVRGKWDERAIPEEAKWKR